MAKVNGLLLVFCLLAVISVGQAFWPFTSSDNGKTGTEEVKEKAKGAMDWTKDKMPDKEELGHAAQTVADKTKDAAQSTSDFAAKKGSAARDYLANSPRPSEQHAKSPSPHPEHHSKPASLKSSSPHDEHHEHHEHHDHKGHPPHKGHPKPHEHSEHHGHNAHKGHPGSGAPVGSPRSSTKAASSPESSGKKDFDDGKQRK